jgi:hypothetical protein
MLVFPQEGARNFWDLFFGFLGTNLNYHLYQNDWTPGQPDVLANYVEATFSGYGGGQASSGWSTAVTVSGHGKVIGNLLQWNFSGGVTTNNIFGYYVVRGDTGKLLYAERDPRAPVLMQPGSLPYQVLPTLTDISEFL